MNRTLLVIARCVIALLLLVGIFGLVVLLLYENPTLAADTKGIVEGAIAQLVILLGFVVHAIFAPGAQVSENPTLPPQAANLSGVKP